MKKLLSDTAFNLSIYWRWVFLPGFFVVAHKIWGWREYFFSYLPFNKIFPFPLAEISNYAILSLVGVVFWLATITTVKKPIFEDIGIDIRLRQNNLKNNDPKNPKNPVLISKRRDWIKKRGIIYTFRNYGISPVAFDKRAHQLNTILKGKVYDISEQKDTTKTDIYVIPKKYDTPNLISESSDYLTRGLINLLCVGRTGSGKSYALAVILGSLARFNPDISITICDYKKSSFTQYDDMPNFYGYEDVPDGIRTFYKEFTERLEANDAERNKQKRVLLIDEYGALIAAQEKKQADELRTMIANMLFMSRSLGMIVIIGIQRADAEYFKSGARDQFKAILALGNLSKEQKQMLFADYKDELVANNGLGEGYLLIDGSGISRVKVVSISKHVKLDAIVREAMVR